LGKDVTRREKKNKAKVSVPGLVVQEKGNKTFRGRTEPRKSRG